MFEKKLYLHSEAAPVITTAEKTKRKIKNKASESQIYYN